ncbi:MAG: hypothetical protein P8183_20595, partial [Anaerolineae bacterium]
GHLRQQKIAVKPSIHTVTAYVGGRIDRPHMLGGLHAQQVRAVNPAAHVCFYGLYAWLNRDYLLAEVADSVIGGEYEQPLVDFSPPASIPPRPTSPAYLSPRRYGPACRRWINTPATCTMAPPN